MRMETKVELQRFYPTELEVANIYQTDTEIRFKMSARSKSCTCPKCGTISVSIPGRFPSPVRFPEITIPSNRKSQYRTWKSAFRWLYNGDMHWFYQCKSIIRRSVFYDQIS